MLGVHRCSVTQVIGDLQDLGTVRLGRGHVEVLDRAGLKTRACECYRESLPEDGPSVAWATDGPGHGRCVSAAAPHAMGRSSLTTAV